MMNKEAIKWLESIDKKYIHGGDEWYDEQRHEVIKIAIKALYLLVRLEGFKYVTTDVMLKEHETAHFDVYKTGWNDAIQAVIDASDMPVTDIIKAIKENEVKQNDLA